MDARHALADSIAIAAADCPLPLSPRGLHAAAAILLHLADTAHTAGRHDVEHQLDDAGAYVLAALLLLAVPAEPVPVEDDA